MLFLGDSGENNQHKGRAYSGMAVSEDDWGMFGCSRMCCCFPDSGHGACISSVCGTEGLPLPCAVYGQASLAKDGENLQGLAPVDLECVNLKRLLPNL